MRPGSSDAAAAARIALFGGTFDPPHRGHVAVARAAADAFHLDRVLFAPAGRQPLKHEAAEAGYADRLRMVELACAADARFAASRVDEPHPHGEPNYTVDALAALALKFSGARLFNLVGADSFASLARWHDPEGLLEVAEWIVVSRPGVELAEPHGLVLTPAQRGRMHALDSLHEDVSATELRARLHAGDPCADLLPPGVERYILEHRLYR